MFKGHRENVERDAESIARRFVAGEATITALMREYRVAYTTLTRVLRAHVTDAQWTDAVLLTHDGRCGVTGRFRRGHRTWNRGRKGVHMSRTTEFKPGCLRGQAARKYRAVGAITVRYDTAPKHLRGRKRKGGGTFRGSARRFIKIADDGPPKDRWLAMARYNWIQAHGPIPDGLVVVMLDGDTMHDSLDNLALVTHAESLAILKRRRPDVVARCYRRAADAARMRHRRNRVLGIPGRRPRPTETVSWECPACGWDSGGADRPARCPKCGAMTLVMRRGRAIA